LPAIGDAKALVTIVEFTEYACSYCQKAEKTIALLRARYGAGLRVVVAEHTLPSHANGRASALAALAAAGQGHFTGMHERLFSLSGALDDASIAQAAREEGLEMSRFDADRAGDAVAALERSERLASDLGVRGTPSFFINGRMVVGDQPLATFEEVIEERLAAARRLVAAGVHPEEVYSRTVGAGLTSIVEEC
jgi:protein-disulfide isomerase